MPSPVLRDLPLQFETERLLIRCPRAGDGRIVHDAVVESLPALREFPASLPWAMAEPSVEASERFCREGQASYLLRTTLPMLLFLKGTDILVGSSGLHGLDWSVPKCEIGYWGRSSFTGQGYMTEAVDGITVLAFTLLGVRRIQALPDAENVRSCLVCERAGYLLEGTLRHERAAPDGTMRDTRVYALVG